MWLQGKRNQEKPRRKPPQQSCGTRRERTIEGNGGLHGTMH